MRRLAGLPPDLVAGGVGAIGALVTVAAAFGLGLPLWLAFVTAGVGYAGTRLALTQIPHEPIDPVRLTAATGDLAREVVVAARGETRKLLNSASTVREPRVRAHLMNLYTLGSRVIGEVERNPQRLGSVRRLLTYYLPAAARLGEGFQVLETARYPDGARLAATATMIERLHETCARQADRLNETDVDGLDVELRLLGDALQDEERRRPAALAAPGMSLPEAAARDEAPVDPAKPFDSTPRL